MFKVLTLKDNNDYFLSLSQRSSKGVYFYRCIGFDDNILKFLRKYEIYSQNKGVYIKENILNPSDKEVKECLDKINENFALTISYITDNTKILLNYLNTFQVTLISESVFEILNELYKGGANANILKNAYVKFMCWSIRFQKFLRYIGNEKVPKVLYEGEISKYEVYMLRILSLCGCDVLYVNFNSDENFIKFHNNQSKLINGKFKGNPKIHFSKINLEELEKEDKIKEEIQSIDNKIVQNTWINEEDFFEVIEKTNTLRGVLTNSYNKIYNMLIQYLGVDDKGAYNNRLLSLKQKLQKSKKSFLLIEGKIANPTIEEVNSIKRENYLNMKDLIKGVCKNIYNSFQDNMLSYALKALTDTLENIHETNLNKLNNFAIKQICWLKRYSDKLVYDKENLPIVIYYGDCISSSEAYFLKMLSQMPVDVIYISPNKEISNLLGGKVVELPNSESIIEFPTKEMKVKASTVAYKAEKEIETTLYNDTGLYKNQQFARSTPITLKTTYEEISIIWKEQSKFRPSFKSEDNKVYVPNIFAKVCGVKDGDINKYIKEIKELITDETIYYKSLPFFKSVPKLDNISVSNIIINNEINKRNLKSIKEYKYDYLNSDTQNYIIEKIQELIDLKWIEYNNIDLNTVILSTLLNLDKPTLNLIQKFDFTKEVPKIVIVDTDESMANLEDCIYILFLNLIGFDIIVFTPTGYRNIEKYIKEECFENYIIGDFIFNLKAPNIKTATAEKTGFFEKFFKL